MHIKYFIRLSLQPYWWKKKNPTKNMLLQNKNYNKVNATLDNHNQKPIFYST